MDYLLVYIWVGEGLYILCVLMVLELVHYIGPMLGRQLVICVVLLSRRVVVGGHVGAVSGYSPLFCVCIGCGHGEEGAGGYLCRPWMVW